MFLAFKLRNLITVPFGWLLGQLYTMFDNYGVAMIIFGILVQLIMLPIKAKSKIRLLPALNISDELLAKAANVIKSACNPE